MDCAGEVEVVKKIFSDPHYLEGDTKGRIEYSIENVFVSMPYWELEEIYKALKEVGYHYPCVIPDILRPHVRKVQVVLGATTITQEVVELTRDLFYKEVAKRYFRER